METKTIQNFNKKLGSSLKVAEKYYQILATLSNLGLGEKEIQLAAFTAVKGNISSLELRKEFVETHNTTRASLGNMIGKLKKKQVLVEEDGIIKINPYASPNFNEPILLNITLNGESI